MNTSQKFNDTKLRFNATESAEYECIASNKYTGLNPVRKRVKVTVYGKEALIALMELEINYYYFAKF